MSQDWPARSSELRAIEKITPYARNARTHPDEQVAQIAASIREWGYDDLRFCVENLEWVTVAENNAHAIATGLFNPRAADQSARRKVLPSDFGTIHAMHRHFGVPRSQIAKRNRVCRQTVDTIIKRADTVFSSMGIAA